MSSPINLARRHRFGVRHDDADPANRDRWAGEIDEWTVEEPAMKLSFGASTTEY
jgi:hypothetical protein